MQYTLGVPRLWECLACPRGLWGVLGAGGGPGEKGGSGEGQSPGRWCPGLRKVLEGCNCRTGLGPVCRGRSTALLRASHR